MNGSVIVNPTRKVMLLVPICALVLLAVSVYLISRTSDNVAAISDNTFEIATNFDGTASTVISLATISLSPDMTSQTIDGRSYTAFPEENVSRIIASQAVLAAERDALYKKWQDLRAERDRLTRDTTITISLSMFFVVASFVLAFFLPASKPATARVAEEDADAESESSEEAEDKSS